MILVDTNVILDVIEEDPAWADWSQAQLDRAALQGALLINPVIYAELSIAFHRIEELEVMVSEAGLIVESIPREALFLAGKAFLQYRRQKGTKRGVLPDFFIGAHASVLGIPLLTRDAGKYAGYFPQATLITPG
ncbi:MAG: type II toxin-antitoxin system VapC family toxin [Candidatus Contendobacter sp.]